MESCVEVMMDCPEVKAETSADDKHLEPLLILEEGDEPSDVINSGERGRAVLRVWAADENTEDEAAEGSSHDHNNVRVDESKSEAMEMNEERNATLERQVDDTKTHEGLSDGTAEVSEEKPTAQAEVKLRPKDTLSPHDAKPTVKIYNNNCIQKDA